MSEPKKKLKFGRRGQGHRTPKSHYVTKGGRKIKLHQTLGSRMKARKDARLRNKAAYLATMPKGRFKRMLFRMHPKRVARYWFSRKGGIMALKVTGVGILATFLLLVGVFAYFRKDLPNLRDISGNNIGGSNRYYDRTGQTLLWEDYDNIRRTPVKGEVAQVMKDATIAVEDKDFFKHGGFDVRGIARAGFNNALGKGSTQGGSTITQQLVKLTQNWSKERTYSRKVKELILSVELERSYSKKEILNGYLDTAPYGDITYGVEAASKDYFQKSAKDLTLDEAAFLAAMPKSPTLYSPYGARHDPDELIARQDYILDLMAAQGKITNKQRDAAKKVDTLAALKPRQDNKYANVVAPWFVQTAKDALIAERGGDTVKLGGLKIITTLDLDKQRLAEEQVQKGLRQVQRQGGDTIAFVGEDVKTGQVLALVGGTDFNNKQYGENNYAHDYKLPPGSSIKPYSYLSVIENTDQFGAGTVLYDSPDPIPGGYECTNKSALSPPGNCLKDFDRRYPGPMTLRYALGGSRNVPAVKAMVTAGIDKTINTAGKLGLKDKGGAVEGSGYKCYKPGTAIDNATKSDEADCGPSAGIGDGAYLKLDEHIHAFSTISRNGKLLPQAYILKIEDASGKVMSEWKPSPGKQVVRDEAAYIVADMLADPNATYFGNPKPQRGPNGWKFSVKTGTTNDAKDGMLIGFSTQYVAGLWVGYHDRSKSMSGSMEAMTAPIWSGWMREVHKDLKPEERPRPAGIQTLPAYVVRTHVGSGSVEPSPATDLYPSWYKARQKAGTKQTIDKVSNKLATDCTPARAKEEANNAAANQFASDKFHPGGGGGVTSSTEKDDIHKCEDAKPSITITAPPTCAGSCSFTATVTQGTHPLSSARFAGVVNLKIGDQAVQSQGVSGSPTTLTFNVTAGSLSGAQNVTAEVVDSVLYDDTDSVTVSFSAAPTAGQTITMTEYKAGAIPGRTRFKWTGSSGDVTMYKSPSGPALCTSSAGSCDTAIANAPPGTPVHAANATSSSPPVTVN